VASAELAVRVTPRAEADRVGPYDNGVLRVRVARPPVDGEANQAVARLLARALGVPPSSLTLVAGARSRSKRFRLDGVSTDELASRIAELGD
jgi:uncharacterized protein